MCSTGTVQNFSQIADGLTCAFNNYHMGVTAENIVEKYSLSRAEQDAFALASQTKAKAALAGGRLKPQTVAIEKETKKGAPKEFCEVDEYVNAKASKEGLEKLRAAFKKEGGSVTAGNASGLNDGAAFVVMMSEQKARAMGLEILGLIRGFGSGGVDPKVMGRT